MAREQAAILDPLRRLVNRQAGSSLSDAQLLESFVGRRDQAAFEVLVWRHGAMVLSLCRRVLRDAHEAEDAFQATFLVFARKAGAIGRGDSVACWLYKVAYRIAIRLRASGAKRASEPLNEVPAPGAPDGAEWRDLRPVLDDEIAKLPEKYRAPFVLCYLEGRTNEEAAAQLGCPKGTVLSRLSRGRERLRERLARRGVTLTATALAATLTQHAASAANPPAALVGAASGAAVPFATGTTAFALAPARVATLTDGVLHAMKFAHLKAATVAVLSLFILGTSVGWAALGGGAAPAPNVGVASPNGSPKQNAPAARHERPAGRSLAGEVVAVATDGKSFTVAEDPERGREETVRTVVNLSETSAVKYNAVGANGARPVVGYEVEVQLADGSTDVAATATFRGAGTVGRVADRTGVVTAVAQNGKSMTLKPRPEKGGAERPPETIPFDARTTFAYHHVGQDGTVLAAGLTARVWFADGSKAAGQVELSGSVSVRHERDKAGTSDLDGTVRRASPDGKTFVVEVPPAKGEGEPTRIVLKLGTGALLSFNNVPTGGAKVVPGMSVRVWLEKGTKDVVAQASLGGTVPARWQTVSGTVVAVARDGLSYTVEQPVTMRGEEPKRVEIKLTAKTEHVYFGVGPGEAKVTVGYRANARILDGTTDTAAKITFFPPARGR